MPTRARKEEYAAKLTQLLTDYKNIMIVGADNVGSKQFQDIRAELRAPSNKIAQGVVLMGKNTLIRRTINMHPDERVKKLLPYVKLNMGFIFSNADLSAVRDIVYKHVKGAPAKSGAIADKIISIPPGPTGQPPDKTAFFQALQIPTKINRGQIEITNEVDIIQPGEKVGPSQAALLQMLDIKPFTYGLKVLNLYQSGDIFSSAVLEITSESIATAFCKATRNVAALGFVCQQPNQASIAHSILKGFQDLVSIAMACPDYSFKEADTIEGMIGK